MKIELTQEDHVQDAATNQTNRQRKRSARESSTDSGRKLSEVLQGVETALPVGASSPEIHQVACDSRKVRPGALFFGLFGTIAYHPPLGDYPAPNTTPESVDLQGFFAEIRDAGGTYAVLEASSHALAMDRLWGCHFQAAVFTNLTREHMDFHKTFEDYFAAKKR